MPDLEILEVSSLAERHPELALVEKCAIELIIRLSQDPVAAPPGISHRAIRVRHRSRQSAEVEREFEVRWNGLEPSTHDRCRKYKNTVGDETLTEWAAIGMMGLLIHRLENGTIVGLVRKGSGGDYSVCVSQGDAREQVEVSGIRVDATSSGLLTTARVADKQRQLLEYVSSGFVSVTTFAYSSTKDVLSVLHHVVRSKSSRVRRPKRGRR